MLGRSPEVPLEHPVFELSGVQLHERFKGDGWVKSGIAEVLMPDGIEVEVPQMQGPLDAVKLYRMTK